MCIVLKENLLTVCEHDMHVIDVMILPVDELNIEFSQVNM